MRRAFTTPSGDESPATWVAAYRIQARICPTRATPTKAHVPSRSAVAHPAPSTRPRSSAGRAGGAANVSAWSGGGGGGGVPAPRSVPQLEQNLASSALSLPHLGQITRAVLPRPAR